jgi:excisionase family DNA binding protein
MHPHYWKKERRYQGLAALLKVPLSWVYEQSRQGNIPTHRLGRYIRFDLQEVLASRKKS